MGEGYSSDEMRKYNERGSQWLDSCSHSDYDSSVISFSENSSISFRRVLHYFTGPPLSSSNRLDSSIPDHFGFPSEISTTR